MEIRPTDPVRAALPPERRQEVEGLVRDVVESGAQLQAPRKLLPFWKRTLDPEEAGRRLQEGDTGLLIRLPGQAALPLRSAEDLEEAAVFQKLRPAPQGTSQELLALQDQGFQFADDRGRSLGAYGAYNALTDPAHQLSGLRARNGNGAIPLDSEVRLHELHAFSQTPQAELERAGYQFFADNRVQPAFLAHDGQIGRDGQPWIDAGDPTTQKERLEQFSRRLEQVGGQTALVRRLETGGELSTLVQGLSGEGRRSLARLALSEMTPAQLTAAASGLQDSELRGLWLEAGAARRQDCKVALSVYRQAEFAREAVWQEAGQGHADALDFTRSLLQHSEKLEGDKRRALGNALLNGLAEAGLPQAGAAAAWKCQDPLQVVSRLLDKPNQPLAELAQSAVGAYDAEAQRRAMAGVKGPLTEELVALHRQLKDKDAYQAVFSLSCDAPSDRTAWQKELVRALEGRSVDYEDRQALGQWLLDTSTAPAAQAARRWGVQDPYAAASTLLAQPALSEAQLAPLAITRYDSRAQRKRMQELSGPLGPSMLALHQKLSDADAYHAVFQKACEEPTDVLKTLTELRASLDQASIDWEDRQALGTWMLDRLAEQPATKRAAAEIRQWQTNDPYQAAGIALSRPNASDEELALQGITRYDAAAQRRYMARLKGPMGASMLELHKHLSDADAYHAVFQKACEEPTDVLKTLTELRVTLDQASVDWEDRQALGNWMLDRLAEQPATKRAAAEIRQWQTSDPYQAAGIALARPTASEDELALQGITRYDAAAQRRYMARLQGPMGASMLELHKRLSDSDAYHAVFQKACDEPGDVLKTLTELRSTLDQASVDWEDRQALGNWMLDRLTEQPSTRHAAEVIRQWQTSDPYQAAGIALAHPNASDDALALQGITRYDAAAQRRYLGRVQGPMSASLLELHQKLSDSDAYHAVFQTACQKPTDVLKTVTELRATLDQASVDWEDRQALGNWMLDRLAEQPSTRRATGVIRQWQPNDPYQAAGIALEHPNDSDDQLARRAITRYDSAAQRRFMAGLQGGSGWLELHKKLSDADAYHAVFELACQNPPGATGQELAGSLRGLFDTLAGASVDYEDRQTLGNWAVAQLARHADTRAAASTVQGWQLRDAYNAADALCDNPTLSTPQELDALALAAIGTWDLAAQERHLAQLAARPGAPAWLPRLQELHRQLESEKARGLIWSMAAQGSAGNLEEVAARLQTTELSWEDHKVIEGLLAQIKAEVETRKLVQGFQEKSQTIAVEENRVLVGGVVIRRKSEKPPEPTSAPAGSAPPSA